MLDLKPLLKAADDLYMAAHKVIEAVVRIREADQYYARTHRPSDIPDETELKSVSGRLRRWLSDKIVSLPGHDDGDGDEIDLFNQPISSSMGTSESYSTLSEYHWLKVPSERLSTAMLQHYGAPCGALDASFSGLEQVRADKRISAFGDRAVIFGLAGGAQVTLKGLRHGFAVRVDWLQRFLLAR
jgi:hypothetical protein